MKNINKIIFCILTLLVTTSSMANPEQKIVRKDVQNTLDKLDTYTANNDLVSISRLFSQDIVVNEIKENKVVFSASKDKFLKTLQGIKNLENHKVSRKIYSIKINKNGLSATVKSSTSEEFWLKNVFIKGVSNEVITLVKRNGKLLINKMVYEMVEYKEKHNKQVKNIRSRSFGQPKAAFHAFWLPLT